MLGSIIVAVLAIPVLAVVSIVMTMGTRERIKRLEFRIAGLEGRLAGLAGEAPHPKPVPPAVPECLLAATEEPEGSPDEKTPVPARGAEAAAAPPAPPPAAPAKPNFSLEERFGTQWVVWAGGIALALGGFFLVRYSIEQGWFGPGMRVLLADAVALALIAAGEWTRNPDRRDGPSQSAHPRAC